MEADWQDAPLTLHNLAEAIYMHWLQEMDWIHTFFLLSTGYVGLWDVWLIVSQLPIKVGWRDASLTLRKFSRSNK